MDVSGYQPRDLSELIAEHQVEHVVVRLYLPEERISQDHSLAQIASASANGASVGAYIWAYQSLDPVKTVLDAYELATRAGIEIPILWFDCETYLNSGHPNFDPGPDQQWLWSAIRQCEALGIQPGIYTGQWWWDVWMFASPAFAQYPLWLAQYDGVPTLDGVKLYGWEAAGHQYSADNGVDLNVFREDMTRVDLSR